ncbi:C2H2-type zinc finger protein [Aspergillus ibericus CBS 121593]|uniref:C2H2-type domain-containing protein n=1 Tax=Aspergillus ibericus CBS 121593 TaxID=1448316 RepID=A0A395H690_9EURO|nr:hypothetical protein BO80DRAFT_28638 [Aspergillus ibericus CBS 121593]RAL02675.1 hypothetical protein BO80DRAFT_28638 [Aspergillus ibericus CBS 121593]
MGDVYTATADRPFACDQCTRSFTRSENLQRHKRTRHGGVSSRTFGCARCHAQFSRSDVYKRHKSRCRAAHQPVLPEESLSEPSWVTGHEPAESLLVTAEGSWLEGRSFTNDHLPTPPPVMSPAALPAGETVATHVKAYFEHFHPSLPLLHRPTFVLSSTPKLLVNITAVMGSLYSVHRSPGGADEAERETRAQWRQEVWQNGQAELQLLAASDRKVMRKPWVLQAWLLSIIYGLYTGETRSFETARHNLRTLVDIVRELGLSHESITTAGTPSWIMPPMETNVPGEDSQTLYSRWMSYISIESVRLALYTMVFLDSHAFAATNARPLMSPLEFGWDLPFPSSLWEAQNASVWLQRVTEHFGASGSTLAGNLPYAPRGLATASLSIATQQLMTDSPGPELLAALVASPFALLCVLSNLGVLVRDFTRSYYQMPPSLPDPSAFHILTQSQNKQIHVAVRCIRQIVHDQAYTRDSPHYLLWRSVEVLAAAIRVDLCRPDQMLVGGIVDHSLLAGLATSTQLALGSYVTVRRSVPLLSRQSNRDEDLLAVLHDLTAALARIAGEDREQAFGEAPWVTVTSYHLLLCIWRALRGACRDIHQHLDTFDELPRPAESCMLIFNTLLEAVLFALGLETGRLDRDPRLWSVDPAGFSSLLDDAEPFFEDLLQSFCKHRPLWGIGPALGILLDDILATGSTGA